MNPWTHRRDPPDKLLDSEIVRLKQARVLIHVSTEDFEFFRHYLPFKHHVLALPTIDESFVLRVNSNVSPSATPIDLLFVGHSAAFNAAAVNWFFIEVWPLVERRGYSLAVVGSVEVWVRKEMPKLYAMFRSYFAGPVAELEPCYRAARCVIAPMVSGTGISIKTVEALALGKPFVGTSKAFRGMPMDVIKQSGIRAHDCPQDFANAIDQALSEEHSAAAASRAVYRELFSNRASFSARDQALKLAAVKTALSSSDL
jgi:glycosyltransferase involved in cell wall biosynthesis